MAQTDKVLELFYTEDGSDREMKFKPAHNVPSFDLLETLQELNSEFQRRQVDIVAKSEIGDDVQKLEDIDAIRANPGATKAAIEMQAQIARLKREFVIEMARVIINAKRLDEAKRELVASPTDSQFWRSQDMEALGAWVDAFRHRGGI